MTDRTDEARHQPGEGRNWEESYGFDFAAGDSSVGGYVRLGLRPDDGVAWYWAAVVGPDRPLVVVRDHHVPLPRGRSLEVRTSGLWADHTCETPLEHWTVGVEAFGVALEDPQEAFAGERGDLCPLGIDVEWEACAEALPDGHGYQQRCMVHGEVRVGAERLDLNAVGWRSHHWGDHDWWSADAPRVMVRGHTDRGLPLIAGQVEVVMAGGLLVAVTLDGEPGAIIGHAPFAVPGGSGVLSRFDRALCKFPAATGWVECLTPPA